MRLIFVALTFAVVICFTDAAANKTTKLAPIAGDNREKRTIKTFASYQDAPPSFISKRISTGYTLGSDDHFAYNTQPFNIPSASSYDPLVPGYVRNFDSHESNSIGNDQQHYQSHAYHHQQPQYLEAPEPIIEIIIKESNETLPVPQAQVLQQSSKPRKEQVQVFYVKYKKDEHKGVVIDDPVAALSPSAYNQEQEEQDDEHDYSYTPEATPAPPTRTTTLRTIIHPDSERYHSNSGIQVTFNTEDKRDSALHNYQEHIEASDLQPVVAQQFPEPRFQQRPTYQPSQQHLQHQQPQQQQQHQQQQYKPQTPQGASQNLNFHQSRQDTRNQFQTQSQFNAVSQHQHHPQRPQHQPLSTHQDLPNPNSPVQAFRNEAQFNQAQRPTRFGTQQSQQLPNQHFENQQHFAPQPPKFRPQPQPIPVHNFQQQQQQTLPSLSRPPPFASRPSYNTDFRQSATAPQQTTHTLDQYRVRQQAQQQQQPPLFRPQTQQPQHQNQQYHQHQAQQHQQSSQIRPSQQIDEFAALGGLVQSTAPNLNPQQQPPQGHDFVNKIVPGTELVPSVSKYEQHITHTVPFGQPIRPFNDVPVSRPQSSLQQQPQQQQQQQQKPQQQQQKPQALEYTQQQTQQQSQIVLPTHIQYEQYHSQQQSVPQKQQNSNQFEEEFFQHQKQKQNQQQQYQNHRPQAQVQQFAQSAQISTSSSSQSFNQYSRRPVQQPLVPGQSVSTLASEVFPKLENQLKQQQYKSEPSQQSLAIDPRNRPTQTEAQTAKPTQTTAKQPEPTKAPSKAQFELPDEVPDDLRAQLLSSGILDNADISILDYDKVGDIPIESLPAEHLANFYGGGGAAQLSSSNKVVTVVKPNGEQVLTKKPTKPENPHESTKIDSESSALPRRQSVDLKVVRFDSNTQKSVTDKYIRPDSTVLPSVEVSEEDRQYNRYLPLKVNGAQFPYPDAKELQGRKISSVVVLAPVDNQQPLTDSAEARFERDVVDTKQIKFVAGDSLKQLLKKPTKENFKRWLDKESKTDIDLQSVVLLVTKNELDGTKEIYMYDIATQRVSKLSGELSSAFVNVAEENANAQDIENSSISDSGIVEQMTPLVDDNVAAEARDSLDDSDSEPSERVHSILSPPPGFLTDAVKTNAGNIQINSGYSVIS